MTFPTLFSRSSERAMSELRQPFNKDCIDSINIEIGKKTSIFRQSKKCKAVIYFRNGDTSGNHEICEDEFDQLMVRVKTFIETL
jgi:hypothetical protein